MMQMAIPEELRIGITNKCNLNCKHCYIHDKLGNTNSIEADVYLKLLDEHKDQIKKVSITGGEPLVTKEEVLSICKKCKILGIKTRLVTNGTLLSDQIIHQLKDSGVDQIQIGIDSINNGFHNFIRQEDVKNKTIDSIKKCIKARIKVSIRYTLAKSNLNELLPTYTYFSKLGIYKFKLRMLFPVGAARRLLQNEYVSGEEWAKSQFDLIQASLNGASVELTSPCLFNIPIEYNSYKESCPCGAKAIYVNWNGDVKYCLFDDYVIGNINDRPLAEICDSPIIIKEINKRYSGQLSFECSSFAMLKNKYDNYNKFIKEYISHCHLLGDRL